MVKSRTEEQIFSDIVKLCARCGYPYVIANLSFHYYLRKYGKTITGEGLAKIWSPGHLNGNEINALVGCMVKSKLDWTKPSPDQIQEMTNKSHILLREYRDRLICNAGGVSSAENGENGIDRTSTEEGLREAIRYAVEPSDTAPFRDIYAECYSNDREQIIKNLNFDPNDAQEICRAISESQADIMNSTLKALQTKPLENWSVLSGFRLNIKKIACKSGIAEAKVKAFIAKFTWKAAHRNEDYKRINDFNQVNVTPIIMGPKDEQYLFQDYPLVEATYDSSPVWMEPDQEYSPPADEHRETFAENFLETLLRRFFGDQAVFQSINVYKGKHPLSKIDCLVVFDEYALLLSKQLTWDARNGDLAALKKDIDCVVQNAYEQAIICAEAMNEEDVKFECPDRTDPDMRRVERIYPICVLADHYPTIPMQTLAFLNPNMGSELEPPFVTLLPPFVCDLLQLEFLTIMLSSPLRLLAYVTSRAQFGEGILTAGELATLDCHLQANLWIDDEFRQPLPDNRFVDELYENIEVRRKDLHGEFAPNGALTKFKNTSFEEILSEIECDSCKFAVGMVLAILVLDKKSVNKIIRIVDKMISSVGPTGPERNLTISLEHIDAGLTIHINRLPINEAEKALRLHMIRRKYKQQSRRWFGLLIEPTTGKLLLEANVSAPHVFDSKLETITACDPRPRIRLRRARRPEQDQVHWRGQ